MCSRKEHLFRKNNRYAKNVKTCASGRRERLWSKRLSDSVFSEYLYIYTYKETLFRNFFAMQGMLVFLLLGYRFLLLAARK